MTAEDLELKRYAASEFRGLPRCLFAGFVKKRGDRRKAAVTEKDRESERLTSAAPTQV